MVTPAGRNSRKGNRVTADRWAKILRSLGARVVIETEWGGGDYDLLVALHARRSHPSVTAFAAAHPARPIAVALTGTDVYGGLLDDTLALESLSLARRVIVLQAEARREVPSQWRRRVRVIYQSVLPPPAGILRQRRSFQVCVLGHLRGVKDPLRTALASRKLPAESRLRVVHLGAALEPRLAERAQRETERNPRYEWRGDLPRWRAMRVLAASHLHVSTSKMEGGANAVMEAIACGTPTLASKIPGAIGILGRQYRGYFPVGDTAALTALLLRAEQDARFYGELEAATRSLAPLAGRERETACWRELLAELKL